MLTPTDQYNEKICVLERTIEQLQKDLQEEGAQAETRAQMQGNAVVSRETISCWTCIAASPAS